MLPIRSRRSHARSPWCVLLGLLLVAAISPVQAGADEVTWNGVQYIPVPVQMGSDTRLVMPEPFDDAWERESDVSCSLLDSHTLIVRPRNPRIEQRLTLRGRNTGTLYLARVSASLPYTPIVRVSVRDSQQASASSGRDTTDVIEFLKAMMSARVPAGTRVSRSTRVLFEHPPYRFTAEEVWGNSYATGIFARIDATTPAATLPVVPANFIIRIPEIGALRAMAAESFELSPQQPSTRAYLVYVRPH